MNLNGKRVLVIDICKKYAEFIYDYLEFFFLGEISNGLTTLKGLALGLGDEIERQNNQLDRLGPKVGKANDHLEHQNKQMKTILRK